jgi:hypothetical protein
MQGTMVKQFARTHTIVLVIALGVLISSIVGFAALSATGQLDRSGATESRSAPALISTDAATQDQLLDEYARYNPAVDGAVSPAMEQLLIEYQKYNPVVE